MTVAIQNNVTNKLYGITVNRKKTYVATIQIGLRRISMSIYGKFYGEIVLSKFWKEETVHKMDDG